MRTGKLYEVIASAIDARARCARNNNREWFDKWGDKLRDIERNALPRGSGIDCGTKIDLDASNGEKIVLLTSFHHMDEGGCYDGWTEHRIVVVPSFLGGFDLKVGGRDRNGIKEYLGEIFANDLAADYPEDK